QNVLFGQASDIVADPNSPGTFYAALPGDGIYESTKNGQQGSWALLSSNPSAGLADIQNSGDLRIAVAPGGSPTSLWVLTVDQSAPLWTLVHSQPSAGGMTSFTQVASASSGQLPILLGSGRYAAQLALAADPADPNLAYVATGGNNLVFRIDQSTNPAAVANLACTTNPHGDFRSLAFLDPHTLLETDDGG